MMLYEVEFLIPLNFRSNLKLHKFFQYPEVPMLSTPANLFRNCDYSFLNVFLLVFPLSGCILAGGSKTNQRRADKAYNDDSSTNVLVPVPPQSISQHKLNEKNAKGYWIYFWYHLVGIWP